MKKVFLLSFVYLGIIDNVYAIKTTSSASTESVTILAQCSISAETVNFGTWNRSKYSSGTTASSGGTVTMAGAALTAGTTDVTANTTVTPTTTSDKIKYVSGAAGGYIKITCPKEITSITPTVTSASLSTIGSALSLTLGTLVSSTSTSSNKVFAYPLSASLTLGSFGTQASQTYTGSYTIDVSF